KSFIGRDDAAKNVRKQIIEAARRCPAFEHDVCVFFPWPIFLIKLRPLGLLERKNLLENFASIAPLCLAPTLLKIAASLDVFAAPRLANHGLDPIPPQRWPPVDDCIRSQCHERG